MTSSWTDRLRAAMITLFLVSWVIYAIPFPRTLTPDRLSKAGVKRDIETWRTVLGAVGWQQSPEEMTELAVATVARLRAVEQTLKIPFKPVYKSTRMNQRWGLFAVVTEQPDGLVVEVKRDGVYELVTRSTDREFDWMGEQFRYRRVRGIWDGVRNDRPRAPFKTLSRWVAKQAFDADPDAEAMRLYLERRHLVRPGEPSDPAIEIKFPRRHKRENHWP